jgi:hypothetical protein
VYRIFGIYFLAAAMLGAAGPDAIRGCFTGVNGRWESHGSRVRVIADASGIRLGGHVLEHEGAESRAPVASKAGTVRWISGQATETGELAESLDFIDIYPGITLRLSFSGKSLKSDYLLGTGADPRRIRFRLRGAGRPRIENGDLVTGDLRQPAPVAWQERPEGRRSVDVRFKVERRGWVRFETGPYDRSQPLVIDPYVIGFGQVYGSTGIDQVTSVAADAAGQVYVAGYTDSAAFPSGSLRIRGSGTDAFVMKIDPVGNRILWATYLGGAAYDAANALRVDASGNVFVGGSTASVDFPVAGASLSYRGSNDAFLTKMDAGGALVFSTFFGGIGSESINGLAVQANGSVWAVGETRSLDFPASNTVRGISDAFAARFSESGVPLSSTLFGGSQTDSAQAAEVDAAGDLYFTGTTSSTDFPVTAGALQTASAGAPDAFVIKLAADGSSIRYSTYLGGAARVPAGPEGGNAIAVDSSGAAWVVGTTSSLTFPVAAALQSAHGGGTTDAFVSRLAPGGGSLLFSSLLGGNGSDEGYGVVIHPDMAVSIGGATTSTDLPVVNGLSAGSHPSWDGFVVKLNPGSGKRLLSTYLGASGAEAVAGIALSGNSVFAAGTTSTVAWLPYTPVQGEIDSFVLRIDELPAVVQFSPAMGGVAYNVSGSGCQPGAYTGQQVLSWTPGSQCTVAVTAVQASGETRWRFTGWGDGSIINPRVFTADASGVYTMNFATEYHLATTIAPAGAGSVTALPSSADWWYAAGRNVQLTATPAAGYAFTGWTGVAPSGNVYLPGPVSVTANFACSFTLSSATANPGAAGGSVSTNVNAGTGCLWSAVSGASWIHVSAGANGSGSGPVSMTIAPNASASSRTGTVTIAGKAYTVTQSPVGTIAVTLTTAPVALSYSVSGTGCEPGTYTGSRAFRWVAGSQCAIAVPALQGTGESRWRFAGWADGPINNPRTVPASATSLTMKFSAEHHLVSRVVPANGGSVNATPASADGWYAQGVTVQVKAIAASGFSFGGWTGSAGDGTIVMNGPGNVAANFVSAQAGCQTLLNAGGLTSAPAEGRSGSVAMSVPGANCSWTAASSADWMEIFPISGTTSGPIAVTVYPNFSSQPRSGTITAGGQSLTLTQAGSALTDTSRFVQFSYFAFFGRMPSPAEITFQSSNTLERGTSRTEFANMFLNTEEFNRGGRFVAGLYVGLLDRDPEYGGWLFQRRALQEGIVDQTALVANFLGSAEYRLKFGNPGKADFVRLLYRYILLREPSQAETDWQAGNLGDGSLARRVEMARQFLNSAEFRIGTGPRLSAFLLYATLAQRDAAVTERAALAQQITKGVPVGTLIESLLSSAESQQIVQ